MSWAKVDDALHNHPKVDALFERDEREGLAAMGLWTLVLSCVSGQLTDGIISRRVVRRLAPDHGVDFAAVLVREGLWDVIDGGWKIHDYLDWNPSREVALARRDARSEAGKRGGKASGESRRPPASEAVVEAVASADGEAVVDASAQAQGLNPVPSRPVPFEREGEAACATVDDPHVAAVERVLRSCPRLQFDPLLAAVTNAIAAYPDVDHVKAAHIAAGNASDPNYRTTDAGKALRYAIQELERTAPKPRNGTPGNGNGSVPYDKVAAREERYERRKAVAQKLMDERGAS